MSTYMLPILHIAILGAFGLFAAREVWIYQAHAFARRSTMGRRRERHAR